MGNGQHQEIITNRLIVLMTSQNVRVTGSEDNDSGGH
jgi:hypothetical protein